MPAGRVVAEPVRLKDVAPTLLELAGAPVGGTSDARSLVPLMRGESAGPPPPVYAETLLPQFYMNWAPLRSLHDGRWKLIDAPRPELYDLATDPAKAETYDQERAQTARSMEQALARLTRAATRAR